MFRRTAMFRRSVWFLALSALGLSLAAGCGPDGPQLAPVSGTVTLDGKPVADAAVMFKPEAGGRPATGVTDAAGKFSLETLKPGDGALVGMHQVTVTGVKTSGVIATEDGLSGGLAPGGLQEEWFVPQKYSRPSSSGLVQEVKPDLPPVELKLSSSP